MPKWLRALLRGIREAIRAATYAKSAFNPTLLTDDYFAVVKDVST